QFLTKLFAPVWDSWMKSRAGQQLSVLKDKRLPVLVINASMVAQSCKAFRGLRFHKGKRSAGRVCFEIPRHQSFDFGYRPALSDTAQVWDSRPSGATAFILHV